MLFMFGYVYNGLPYTSDANKTWNPIGLPMWFSRTVLHRAIFVLSGPYNDPNGMFSVTQNQALVYFEVKQPPAGTEQAILFPRPQIFAILDINTTFVSPKSLMYKQVDPFKPYQKGDEIAVWFALQAPACCIGVFRKPSDATDRNAGSMVINPQTF